MSRRLAILLATITLTATILAAAAVFSGPPHARLTSDPNAAEKVTLYQSGLAFVELVRSFDSTGGQTVLEFTLPRTAISDSLVVEGAGVVVKEVRSSLPQMDLLRVGDTIVVHQDNGTWRGTLVSAADGRLILSTTSGTVLIDAMKANAIEVPDRHATATDPDGADVTVLVDAPSGNHTVRLSYLASGPGWTPTYMMDVKTGHLTFFATLTGLSDWKGVQLDLVSGDPHLVMTPRPGPPVMYDTRGYSVSASMSADYGQSFSSSTPLGDLHRYHYAYPLDLARGETVRLPILSGDVTILRHYYEAEASTYATTLTVLERLELKNGLTEPLPPGVARFYRDGVWIGEDTLASTPIGARSNVTLARSEDVQARVAADTVRTTGNVDTYGFTVFVENHKAGAAADTIDMRITFRYPDYRTRLVSATPEPNSTEGTLLVWNALLGPGASRQQQVTYETTRSP